LFWAPIFRRSNEVLKSTVRLGVLHPHGAMQSQGRRANHSRPVTESSKVGLALRLNCVDLPLRRSTLGGDMRLEAVTDTTMILLWIEAMITIEHVHQKIVAEFVC
jgi:hypothetical protein